MIGLDTGRALRAAGLVWSPAPGDRFVAPERDLDDQVFVVSEMVIEVRETPSGQLLAFNGTTEWALDSMDTGDAVWLPRRARLLGGTALRASRGTQPQVQTTNASVVVRAPR